MKCLPECNFKMLPSNGPILVQHMQDCDLHGPLQHVENPVVVWRDGGFAVVATPEEGERTFDIGYKRISHEIELPVLDTDLIDGVNVEPVRPVETTQTVTIQAQKTPEK